MTRLSFGLNLHAPTCDITERVPQFKYAVGALFGFKRSLGNALRNLEKMCFMELGMYFSKDPTRALLRGWPVRCPVQFPDDL